MDKEIQSLLAHNTWKEIDSLPAGRKATKSRWVPLILSRAMIWYGVMMTAWVV